MNLLIGFLSLIFTKDEIDKIDYDICIIGTGAYGLPLAAHIKRSGKKGFHLGGVSQLLFGILGRRWENTIRSPHSTLFNEHWVLPNSNETPKNANVVESACY